jgi:hypothetical protein
MNTELKYRTFNELLSEVGADLIMYNNENLIEPSQLIKVAQRVNYDLGLRINGTKNVILDVENYKVKLPDDFYVINYAYLCINWETCYPAMSGRHTENVIVNPENPCTKCCQTDCNCEFTYVQECQNGEKIFVQVIEKRRTEVRVYRSFRKVEIATSTDKWSALNTLAPLEGIYEDPWRESGFRIYIRNGFLYTNFEKGKLYMSYQGALEDNEGNLLVLDHPMINEYYEYAIKQRVLENLYMNGEDVTQRMQLIEQRLRAARNNALTIVNTPNFSEMYQLWKTNRKAMYSKYYDMFKAAPGW